MNKYNIKEFLQDKLAEHKSTLKQTSYDMDKSEYLCNDSQTEHVYDFDSYVESNFKQGEFPASPDAILLGDKKFYFVEFKNQDPNRIDKKNMKDKFEKGTVIIRDLLADFIPQDVEYIFCVVHKKQNSMQAYQRGIESTASRLGLEAKNKELGGFYNKIIADSVDYYQRFFKQLQC